MKTRFIPVSLAMVLLTVACTPSQETTSAHAAIEGAQSAIPVDAGVPGATQGVEVSDAWSRAMPPGAKVAGGFMTIRNGGQQDDRLVSLRSPAAMSVDVHEMREVDGVMQMRPVTDGLTIPAGGEVVLAPGGYHLMFMQPTHAFEEGEAVNVTLTFEHAGDQDVEFKVLGMGATGPEGAGSAHEGSHH